MTTTISLSNPFAAYSFPRTGKRGVPQQFPRRLYEMLDSETKLIEASPNHPKVIAWSDSGTAFRIYDVTKFSVDVLPKYFRTKKFSSFQRNLNLYGFAKIRRGPESDMYAHPSFVRDRPKSLLNLRKLTTAARKKLLSPGPSASSSTISAKRVVSPPTSPLGSVQGTIPSMNILFSQLPNWPPQAPQAPLPEPVPARREDRGRLDLLALALEQEAYMGA